ncbi:TRAP transporter large permease [Vineibacter terrae]|uniref:TRAP transporter large permease protein n=1 Tax=Vineibacter terrae TaxID=2586908 RepID=A0A5C8P9R7_9HYPH|nr:TRAP transporter large permease [Vineibacter terrae]TXL70329.1 TRAP transporter large permease [Vineibacter terrae]
MTVTLIGFAALFSLIFLRVPIGLALGFVGFLGYATIVDVGPAASLVAQTIRDAGHSYTLSVIPMFVLMGNLVARSGLADDLYAAANAFIGHRKGGLAMATVIACGGFASVSGSSVATAATMSKVSFPAMRRFGYNDRLATGAIAAGGTLGILIPPSVIMVIYGVMTETHIGKLFAAGLLPGLVGIAGYIAAVRWTVWRDPASGPAGPRMPWRERWRVLRGVVGVLTLFLIVMGGIYGGLFTPTEASGIGAFGATVFAAFRKRLTTAVTYDVLSETARTTAMIFFVLMGALIFAEFVSFAGMPEALVELIRFMALSPLAVIAVMMGIYLVLGCVLDSLAMILLTVPIFFPIVMALGYDPVWFGVLIVVVIEIGLITPPIGMNVFVLNAMLADVPVTSIFRGIVPFLGADIVRLAILVALPGISLFLPKLFFG